MKQTLKISNIKRLKDASYEWDNLATAMIGANGTGKSTAIQCLETAIMAKGFMKVPVTTGEKEGRIVYSGQDLEKNPIKIIVDINEDGTHEFTASYINNGKLKTIHDVKKIQALVGNYYQLTASDVMSMVKYVDGRREFIQKYLLPLLSEEQRIILSELQISISERKSKDTAGNLYSQRAELNKRLEILEAEIKAQTITPEEEKELSNKDAVNAAIEKLLAEYNEHKNDNIIKSQAASSYYYLEQKRNQVLNDLSSLGDKFMVSFADATGIIINKLKEVEKTIDESITGLYTYEQLSDLEAKIERGRNKKAYIDAIIRKQSPDGGKVSEKEEVFLKLIQIGEEIENNKAEIKSILSGSNLPAGIEIDDDNNILLNGLHLDSTVSSDTECRLAVIELLMKITTNYNINIGEWSVFTGKSREKLFELAEKYDRCLIGQEVTNDDRVTLKVIVD